MAKKSSSRITQRDIMIEIKRGNIAGVFITGYASCVSIVLVGGTLAIFAMEQSMGSVIVWNGWVLIIIGAIGAVACKLARKRELKKIEE